MVNLDSSYARILLRNGAILRLPPLFISLGRWSELSYVYSYENFSKDIPHWLSLLENTFRLCVFIIPAFLYFGAKEKQQLLGWCLYTGGVLIYLTSYLLQIFLPASVWSQSLIGFTAPAWSPIFWFIGIGLVCSRSWLPLPWNRRIYISTALLFLIFHISHTVLIYRSIVM